MGKHNKKDLETLATALMSRKRDYDYLIRRYRKKMLDNLDNFTEYNRYLLKVKECEEEREDVTKQLDICETILNWMSDED